MWQSHVPAGRSKRPDSAKFSLLTLGRCEASCLNLPVDSEPTVTVRCSSWCSPFGDWWPYYAVLNNSVARLGFVFWNTCITLHHRGSSSVNHDAWWDLASSLYGVFRHIKWLVLRVAFPQLVSISLSHFYQAAPSKSSISLLLNQSSPLSTWSNFMLLFLLSCSPRA